MANKEFEELYSKSLEELKIYIKTTGIRPNTKNWNKYAKENGCLLGETIGYIYGKGFNILCRDIIKQLN